MKKTIYFQHLSVRRQDIGTQKSSLKALKQLYDDENIEYIYPSSLQDTSFRNDTNRFDLICMSASSYQLYHVALVREKLKPGGKLILFSGSHRSLEKEGHDADYFFYCPNFPAALEQKEIEDAFKNLLYQTASLEKTRYMKRTIRRGEIRREREGEAIEKINVSEKKYWPFIIKIITVFAIIGLLFFFFRSF
jgi:SAM-dependent methyltransferase